MEVTEFCLLGPITVRSETAVVPVPRGKQRTVLAALLLHAGYVVSLDELAETLWGTRPPPSARIAIHNYVMRLRRSLADAGARIRTQPPGYLIQADASELDVTRFQAHADAARTAAREGSWDTAAAEARAALALWRGEPLADVDSEVLALQEAPRLAEMRLQALETRIDADLHLGRHAEVITELRQLAAAHPLRERLHSMLMLALYRDSRQAEALTVYQHARQVLVEELGADPGAELSQMHQQILTGDPALTVPEPAPVAAPRSAPAPRELPAAVRHFTGRVRELTALTAMLDDASEQRPAAMVIAAIAGTAGVGKTALAVHWAHQVAGRFPDGQLYADLRGYDPAQPVSAADVLAGFLRALGVPGQDIPAGETERAARYRSLLAGRQMLVVLDNARSVEQVRPLLPGSPACAVVVTSRDTLAGLIARDGAVRLEVSLFPLPDAVRLLRELIGERATGDPRATAALAALCCRLPLALRVAAELAASRPSASLSDLAAELADQKLRLDLLDTSGDPRTAVRTVFSWSCRYLDARAACLFRLAALHPGSDLDLYAAAALIGTAVEQTRPVLDALARAYLMQPSAPHRYGMHGLLRAYAREQAASHEPAEGQRVGLTRLFDYYLYTAAAAMDTLDPAERHLRPRLPPPPASTPPVTDPDAARAWLDAERANLVAVTVHAAGHGWPAHATKLAVTVHRYLYIGSHCPEATTIHTSALTAARHCGDRPAEATALKNLAGVHLEQGRYQQAASHYAQALAMFRQTRDRVGEANVLNNLAGALWVQGRYVQAASHLVQALAMSRQSGERAGEARALSNLGTVEEQQGRFQQATRHLQQALTIAEEIGHGPLECYTLQGLGRAALRQGRYQQAASHLGRSLSLSRAGGYRFHETHTLAIMGQLYLRQGRLQEAISHLRQSLSVSQEIGDRSGKADALNTLGKVLLATGQAESARARHLTALSLATRIGDKYQQARAHHGLGHTYHAADNTGHARRHWQQALALYTGLDVPEAGELHAQLIAVRNSGHGEP